MNRKFFLTLMSFAILFVFGDAVPAWSEAPPIQIDIEFDKPGLKPIFLPDEQIGFKVTVSYYPDPAESVWVSEGFKAKEYYLFLRVIDPNGRLLLAKQPPPVEQVQQVASDIEVPDSPPLASVYIAAQDRFVWKVPCEEIGDGFLKPSYTPDLGLYYDFGIPGWYSVQAQLSVMVFGEDPCDAFGYLWKGTLKSDTRYFKIEGSSEGVKVVPDKWKTGWGDPEKNVPDILVQVWPVENESTADFDPSSFLLNNIRPRKVIVLNPMIKAYFPAKEVWATLGKPQVGQTRIVSIAAKYQTTGQSYGRIFTVKIVN